MLIKRVLNLKNIFIILCFLFSGCGIYNKSFKPEVLVEKKMLSSRKDEIIKDDKVIMVVIATYLNNVNPDVYNTREYFLIEVFSEIDIPFLDYARFSITSSEKFLWAREVYRDEFDDIINVSNKWSKLFLISFNDIDEYDKKNLKLHLHIDNIGDMDFDFTYKVLEMQL